MNFLKNWMGHKRRFVIKYRHGFFVIFLAYLRYARSKKQLNEVQSTSGCWMRLSRRPNYYLCAGRLPWTGLHYWTAHCLFRIRISIDTDCHTTALLSHNPFLRGQGGQAEEDLAEARSLSEKLCDDTAAARCMRSQAYPALQSHRDLAPALHTPRPIAARNRARGGGRGCCG